MKQNTDTSSSFTLNPFPWMRSFYDKALIWAESPRAPWILCGISAIESIFFPIPVDPLLIAMAAAKPKKGIFYGIITTLSSVAGAWVGFAIGYLFWESSQEFFYNNIFNEAQMNIVLERFQANAFVAMFLAGLTPIPFKVFAIAGGIANIALLPFTVGALLGRGLRFITIGAIMYFFGPQTRSFFENHFEKVTIAVGLLVVLLFICIKVL